MGAFRIANVLTENVNQLAERLRPVRAVAFRTVWAGRSFFGQAVQAETGIKNTRILLFYVAVGGF